MPRRKTAMRLTSSPLLVVAVAVLLLGCSTPGPASSSQSATAEPSPSHVETPTASPEPTIDPAEAVVEDLCSALRGVIDDVVPALDEVDAALSARDQAALAAANDVMGDAIGTVRRKIGAIDQHPTYDQIRLDLIRGLNLAEQTVQAQTDALTWEAADGYDDDIAAAVVIITDVIAQLDATGFDRGATC